MTAQPSDKSPSDEQSPELRAALAWADIPFNKPVPEHIRAALEPFSSSLEKEECGGDETCIRILAQAVRDLHGANAQLREELKTANEDIDQAWNEVEIEQKIRDGHFARAAKAEAALALHQKQIDADTANIEDMRAEEIRLKTALAEANAARDIYEHMVITCGVIASHPDATLGDRGAYANEWNSKQADDVRALRRDRDKLRASDAAKDEEIGSLKAELAEAKRYAGYCEDEMSSHQLDAAQKRFAALAAQPNAQGESRNKGGVEL